MAKLVIEKINTNTIEVLGKTVDSATYSGDAGSRNAIKRAYVTLDDVEDNMTVRGADDTIIRKVEKLDKAEIGVSLVNAENISDGKSLATAILKDVYAANGVENDMTEIFVMRGTNETALGEISEIAYALAGTDTGRRALGKWYPTSNGKRVIIRVIAPVNNSGKVA